MGNENSGDETEYDVVVNDEGQFSVWWKGRSIPAGWRAAGYHGIKSDCLSYIESVWIDMRPKSLRESMDRVGSGGKDRLPNKEDRCS
jgi:MbtH protein